MVASFLSGVTLGSSVQLRFFRYGLFLFLLGLLIGFASPAFRNPRLVLSAHLEGVMNGMVIVLVGLIWNFVRLSDRQGKIAFWFLVFSGYLNWFACVLGAAFGASRMTPIAGAWMTALPWQENLVAASFGLVGVTITVAVVLLLWGLRPGASR